MRAVKLRKSGQVHPAMEESSDDAAAAAAHDHHSHFAADATISNHSTTTSSGTRESKNTTLAAAQHTLKGNSIAACLMDLRSAGRDTSADEEEDAEAQREYGERDEEVGDPTDTARFMSSPDPLAVAIARDAPLNFTARDDPCVVARLPLAFHEMLPVIDQQLLYRQRQDAHQLAIDSASSSLLPPRQQSSSSSSLPPVSDFIRDRLPLAVGRVPGCKAKLTHPTAEETPDTAHGDEKTRSGKNATRTAATAAKSTDQLSLADEQRMFRERVTEEVLGYLLNRDSLSQRPAHAEGETGIGEDTTAASPQQHVDDEQRYAMVEACLSGLREVATDSVEYGEILRRLVQIEDTRTAAAASSHPPRDGPDTEDVDVHLPAYVRQLLVGRNLRPTPTDTHQSVDAAAAGVVAAARGEGVPALASAEPRAPVVTMTTRAALDALLPPRLLLYYIVSYETAVAVQQQRRLAQDRRAALQQVLREHPDDRQSMAELKAVTELLAGPYAHAPVGVVLIVLERTSDVQAPRAYLHGLEESLDEILARCHARCCGRPLKLSNSAQNAQRQATAVATAATLAPTRPAEAKQGMEKSKLKSRASGPATKTTVLSVEKHPVITRTTRPLPARPAPLSSSGGGSASAAATLNVVELNAERRLVQADLLSEELLRQVVVDLPERGVLLRRLLDEARLSLDARGVVARERVSATQERLLDGQDEREALAEAHVRLDQEAAVLRERLAFLKARRAGLEAWVEERVARTTAEHHARVDFNEKLRQRLTAHTEAMKAAQEAARQSALA